MSREVSATISSLIFPKPEPSSSHQVELEIFLEDPTVQQDTAVPQDDAMKIVPSTYSDSPSKNFLLPLVEDPEEGVLTKENSIKFSLRCVRANAEPKYQVQIRILTGNESVRQVLKWRRDVDRLIPGLDLTTAASACPVIMTTMTPIPAAKFAVYMDGDDASRAQQRYDTALAAAVDPAARAVIQAHGVRHYWHLDDIEGALNFVVTEVLPHKVLARVKRSLRRDMRKPPNMPIRKYWGHLSSINVEEVTMLPPFGPHQQLTADEMVDILLYGSPKSWSKELDRQGIDPYTKTAHELVGHLENIEAAEDFDPTKKDSKKKASSNKSNNSAKKSDGFYCMLHGKNNTHNTEDCTKLKAEAKRLKGDGKSKSSGKDSGKKSNWKKKASDASDKAKSEISALVKKSVKTALKDLKAADKKRKPSKNEDSSDEELNVIDNLEQFNYATSKMSLDDSSSDTESEVSV